MTTTTVTANGQVTIPKAVRELLRIAPGSKVDFQRAADEHCPDASRQEAASRFQKRRGHAGKGLDTEAIMAMTRDKA
ncbi:AbrB/MazE/SpoVT family DNA-binding domain-containing protein [Neorhizobium galegae]|nr:AbrB/MazE/SpoVT family DNA-binding domain-containing protein [Neorhizobium galegae]KAA9384133.1 AbrB/MazE/SpoVT family DNA-binding domain-containing protein [Neorhizobium galegae]MCM2498788.1 AbrB/MazE/SpoVT family DNA-binding domain-containing protein [Neorhizobium galegae]